jgi:hypothetical protein
MPDTDFRGKTGKKRAEGSKSLFPSRMRFAKNNR